MKAFDHKAGTHLPIAGAEIYYEDSKETEKPVLILLHGGFGSIEDFNTIIPLIKPQYRLLGIDSRGQGRSTLGDEVLSYQRLQKDIEAIVSHLKIDEVNVFGISDGGIAAYRLAAYSDIKINKLITIGSRWNRTNVEETRDILSGVTAESWKKKFPQTFELYQRINPQPDFDKLSRQVVQMWLDEKSYPNDDVKNIKCKTLIIRGDKDHLTKRKFVADLADKINQSVLSNIAFAGHEVYREQSEILIHTINQFLA